jgi:hypothetical protein
METGREEREHRRVTGPEEMETRLREQGQRIGYQAREQGEQMRENVASGLHTAAEKLRQQSMERGQPELARRVADPLDRSAQYLGTHSLPEIQSDITRTARERPLLAAGGVFVTAFLVGRLLRRR